MKKFTDSHEWVEMETSTLARIGISQYAQKELGEIVYVELPKEKSFITSGQEAAVLESTKAAADIYSPVSGQVVAVNPALFSAPQLVNQSAEEQGWLFKVEISNSLEVEKLMELKTYIAMVTGSLPLD